MTHEQFDVQKWTNNMYCNYIGKEKQMQVSKVDFLEKTVYVYDYEFGYIWVDVSDIEVWHG